MADDVLVEQRDRILIITINRPAARNAIDAAVTSGVAAAMDQLDERKDLSIGILTGAGGTFCAGMDLKAFLRGEQVALPGRGLAGFTQAPPKKPLIAAVEGYALAGGFELALACDLVVASDRSRFAEIFVRRGLSVDCGGSWILPRLVGLHRAKELCLTGDIIDASEAARIGLVNRLSPTEGLDEAVTELISRLSQGAPLAQLLTKRLLNEGLQSTLEQAVNHEAMAQVDNLGSADAAEARDAFRQRRPASFTGAWPGR